MSFKQCLVLALLLASPPAFAQDHSHAAGHADYQSWTNQNGRNCCNKDDCRGIENAKVRIPKSGDYEVQVEGEWCPVKPWMYLKTGNSPDWSVAHVCVLNGFSEFGEPPAPVCERLICFQPQPGF